MIFKKKSTLTAAILATLTLISGCNQTEPTYSNQQLLENVNSKIQKNAEFNENSTIIEVEDTDANPFKSIKLKNGATGYITADGKYLISGQVLALEDSGEISEINQRIVEKNNADIIKTIKPEYLVSYLAENEKHSLYVFTDPACPYCRKLHEKINELVSKGVSIHYVPWLKQESSGPVMRNIWCSADKKAALEKAFKMEVVKKADKNCKFSMDEIFTAGIQLSVNSTPTMFTPDGKKLTGAIPVNQIMSVLEAK